ncbi:MAG: hydroxyacylglutathione hydrolase [Thiobacillaceae bacterium]
MHEVIPLPALHDNYIWLIHDGRHAVAVDPGEAGPILSWLEARHMPLAAILITHHHADHVGGVADLTTVYACPVYGPPNRDLGLPIRPVADGGQIVIPQPKLRLTVLAVPGHTRDHLAYYGHGHLFCGDTLFSCGCGRLFEGTPAQMLHSLRRLAALPGETQVCCAHEYTLANIAFARTVDPDNPELKAWAAEADRLRSVGRPTLPVRLARERRVNPFLRCDQAAIQAAVRRLTGLEPGDEIQTFATLRAMKDDFNQ